MCYDAYAISDRYNLGAGVYPFDGVPTSPHPFDRCERIPVTRQVPSEEKPLRLTPVRDFTVPTGGMSRTAARGLRQRVAQQSGMATRHESQQILASIAQPSQSGIGITASQRTTVSEFTAQFHRPINALLREGEEAARRLIRQPFVTGRDLVHLTLEQVQQKAATIINLIQDTAGLKRKTKFFRGASGKDPLRTAKVGDVVVDKGIVSVSSELEQAKLHGRLVEIRAEPGVKAFDVKKFSQVSGESELLLEPGLSFRVIAVLDDRIVVEVSKRQSLRSTVGKTFTKPTQMIDDLLIRGTSLDDIVIQVKAQFGDLASINKRNISSRKAILKRKGKLGGTTPAPPTPKPAPKPKPGPQPPGPAPDGMIWDPMHGRFIKKPPSGPVGKPKPKPKPKPEPTPAGPPATFTSHTDMMDWYIANTDLGNRAIAELVAKKFPGIKSVNAANVASRKTRFKKQGGVSKKGGSVDAPPKPSGPRSGPQNFDDINASNIWDADILDDIVIDSQMMRRFFNPTRFGDWKETETFFRVMQVLIKTRKAKFKKIWETRGITMADLGGYRKVRQLSFDLMGRRGGSMVMNIITRAPQMSKRLATLKTRDALHDGLTAGYRRHLKSIDASKYKRYKNPDGAVMKRGTNPAPIDQFGHATTQSGHPAVFGAEKGLEEGMYFNSTRAPKGTKFPDGSLMPEMPIFPDNIEDSLDYLRKLGFQGVDMIKVPVDEALRSLHVMISAQHELAVVHAIDRNLPHLLFRSGGKGSKTLGSMDSRTQTLRVSTYPANKDLARWAQSQKRSELVGWHAQGDMRSTYWHEMGHHFDQVLSNTRGFPPGTYYQKKGRMGWLETNGTSMEHGSIPWNGKNFQQYVSEYAKKHYGNKDTYEFMAEVFAGLIGPTPKKFANWVIDAFLESGGMHLNNPQITAALARRAKGIAKELRP